jgi:type II secretory pathway pseudopilin PulG
MTHLPPRMPGPQRGVALVVTLVFLALLTAIGVTTLTSTRNSQELAANFQETNRAFQTAESGITASLANAEWSTDTSTGVTGSGDTGLGYFDYDRQFKDFFPLRRRKSQVFSALHFQRAQFSVESQAEVKTGPGAAAIATTTVGEGIYLVVPKL